MAPGSAESWFSERLTGPRALEFSRNANPCLCSVCRIRNPWGETQRSVLHLPDDSKVYQPGSFKEENTTIPMAALLKWTSAITKRGKYSKCTRTGSKVWDYDLAGGTVPQLGRQAGSSAQKSSPRDSTLGLALFGNSVGNTSAHPCPLWDERREVKWSESRSVVSDSATPWSTQSLEFTRPEY